jgi:hypothetical protein
VIFFTPAAGKPDCLLRVFFILQSAGHTPEKFQAGVDKQAAHLYILF